MLTQGDWKNSFALGFDVSQNRTGWALMCGLKVLMYGHLDRPMKDKKVIFSHPEFCNMLAMYYHDVRGIINFLLHNQIPENKTIDAIVMEDLNIRYATTGKILSQFHAAVKIAASELVNEVYCINNVTVKALFQVKTHKKSFTPELIAKAKANKINGKVEPVKIQMVDAVNKKLGAKFTYAENDEADACATIVTFFYKFSKGTL